MLHHQYDSLSEMSLIVTYDDIQNKIRNHFNFFLQNNKDILIQEVCHL